METDGKGIPKETLIKLIMANLSLISIILIFLAILSFGAEPVVY